MATDLGRLGKLVRMLSSSGDGEVVSAARAIGRELTTRGQDWHSFARHADQFMSKPAASAGGGGSAFAAAAPRTSRTATFGGVDLDKCRDMVDEIMSRAERERLKWNNRERNFIEDMAFRFERFGARTMISEKQAEFIASVHDRFCG